MRRTKSLAATLVTMLAALAAVFVFEVSLGQTSLAADAAASRDSASSHTIVVIDPPGSIYTIAYGINSSGTIAGYYEDASAAIHGFLRDSSGNFTVLDVPGAAFTRAFGINDAGQVVGDYGPLTNPSYSQGYVRDSAGNYSFFSVPSSGQTEPRAINSQGQVAGCFGTPGNGCSGSNTGGFIWGSSGFVAEFLPRNAVWPYLAGINSAGYVTGFYGDSNSAVHGYVRTSGGKITEFDVPGSYTKGGGLGTRPWGINDSAVVAGSYYDTNVRARGFIRDSAGNFTSFDAPGSGTQTVPYAINSAGAITGWYHTAGAADRGFFRSSAGMFQSFSVQGASSQFGYGTYGLSMNATGQIAGYYVDAKLVYHGFLRN